MPLTILEQSLVMFPLVLGLFLSYRLLKVADLGSEASFLIGAAILSRLLSSGYPFLLALSGTLLSGAFVGLISSMIQEKLKLNPLISGILVVFIFQSVNHKIMGRPNISLLGLTSLNNLNQIHLLIFIGLLILALFSLILVSKLGLIFKAVGNNPQLASFFGFSKLIYKTLAFMISNSLASLSGALSTTTQGFADLGMASGVVLIALAIVILGLQIQKICHVKESSLIFFFSAIIYFFVLNSCLLFDFDLIYLKLIIGIALVLFFGISEKTIRKEQVA